MNIIAISRGARYSPNHIGNDAAIFNKVVECLLQAGHEVCACDEETFLEYGMDRHHSLVVTMARDLRTLERLMEWESQGVTIVNSPRGVFNCVRQPMTERLVMHGVPHPQSWVFSTEALLPEEVTYPCWLKRGDSHALVKEDVCYASTRDEALRVVADMKSRGIPSVVVNEHLEGDLVKFYGVQGDTFFHWFYPSSVSHSKFGLEIINGEAKQIPFSPHQLKQCADEAARVLHVPVYGGDAVVSLDGSIRIIDFNDWPSFAPCRDEAAKAIVRYCTSL
ncbi:MAG: hypothetical protein IKU98_07110 [Bacteroidaceae bacterium]|nr:hypothetical protein [Bacteroidaceae bacterium]